MGLSDFEQGTILHSRRWHRFHSVALCWILMLFTWGISLQAQTALFPELRRLAEGQRGDEGIHQEANPSPKNFRLLQRGKLDGGWFAALVSLKAADRFRVVRTFEDFDAWVRFLESETPLVESWVPLERVDPALGLDAFRRLSASEQLQRREAGDEVPTMTSVALRPGDGGEATIFQVAFSLHAAEEIRDRREGFLKDRETRIRLREALSARGEGGRRDAWAQWTALQEFFNESGSAPRFATTLPLKQGDRLVAFEYEVDRFGFLDRVVRFFAEGDIERRIVDGREVLQLRSADGGGVKEAWALERIGTQSEIRRASATLAGQSALQIRVVDAVQSDPRKWNRVEFGENELIQQTSLSMYSVIHAYMDRTRRDMALRKSRLDLFAEPLFAGLSIGGGVSGVGFPIGEAARLAYNLAVGPHYVTRVPSIANLREMMRLLAARRSDPRLSKLSAELLTEDDFKHLRERMSSLSETEVSALVERATEEDLKAMLRLATFQKRDAQYSLFVNILTGIGKVSGESEAGILRDIFNNSYVAPNGDVSVSTILAVVLGEKVLTPLSGVSLRELARGNGPLKAWFQYFNASVDFRAVMNTFRRMASSSQAEKELTKPIPHAPRLSDLAAYEFRVFGFPLLIFHKRGLQKTEREAYENDYAYGLLGTRVVERFATRESMDAEILAGRMVPLGYVTVLGADGRRRNSNLAVFAHTIPHGRHEGKTAVVIYGFKAFEEYSELMQRELRRFEAFETALKDGAVIERLVDAEGRFARPADEFEAKILPAEGAVIDEYDRMLAALLDYRAALSRRAFGLTSSESETGRDPSLLEALRGMGIDPVMTQGRIDLEVDAYYSSFRVRCWVEGKKELREFVRIASLEEARRSVTLGNELAEVERLRRVVARGGAPAAMFIHHAVQGPHGWELGPLLRGEDGRLIGSGVRDSLENRVAITDMIENGPFLSQVRFTLNQYAPTRFDLPLGPGNAVIPVFVSLEFSLGETFDFDRVNPESGLRERVWMRGGQPSRISSDDWVTQYEYRNDDVELSSKTYFNLGSKDLPREGTLVEERLKVMESSARRGLGSMEADQVQASVFRMNHVTGAVSRELYGLYPKPLVVVDPFFVTTNLFRASGKLDRSLVYINERASSESLASRLGVDEPLQIGRQRFDRQHVESGDGNASSSTVAVVEEDLVLGGSKTLYFDASHVGRQLGATYSSVFSQGLEVPISVTNQYSMSFHLGLIPTGSTTRVGEQGSPISSSQTLSYDAGTLELHGSNLAVTGLVATNVWRAPSQNPVRVSTSMRRTEYQYDAVEASLTSRTVDLVSGELIESGASTFNPARGVWEATSTRWHRANVPALVLTEVRNREGFLVYTDYGRRRVRPVYGEDGNVLRSEILIPAEEGSATDQVVGIEQNRRRLGDRLVSTMEILRDGEVIDRYEVERDLAGRTIVDGRRSVKGLNIESRIRYDGGSLRVSSSELTQGGQVVESRDWGEATESDEGGYEIDVDVTLPSGATYVETWTLGEGAAAPKRVESPDGRTVVTTDVFPETGTTQATETFSHDGRLVARSRFLRFESDEDGVPLTMTERERINPWRESAPLDRAAYLRGTSKLYYREQGNRRTYFDLDRLEEVPLVTVDLSEQHGRSIEVKGSDYENAVSVFKMVEPGAEEVDEEMSSAIVFRVDELDLRPLFSFVMTRRGFDRFGNLMEKSFFKAARNTVPKSEANDLDRLASWLTKLREDQELRYVYSPGWMIERTDETWGETYVFSPEAPTNGLQSYAVNQVGAGWQLTSVESRRDVPRRLVEVSRSPTILRRNPFHTGVADFWTAWEIDVLDRAGDVLYTRETVRNAVGTGVIEQSHKRTARGTQAANVGYRIPGESLDPEWDLIQWNQEGLSQDLVGESPLSLTDQDFIYFYLSDPAAMRFQAVLRDASGQAFQVASSESLTVGDSGVAFWSFASHENWWLPDVANPELRLSLARENPSDGVQVRAICVHDLLAQGWDGTVLEEVRLRRDTSESSAIRVSPVRTMGRPGSMRIPSAEPNRRFVSQPGSGGFQRGRDVPIHRNAIEEAADQDALYSVTYRGLPIVVSHASDKKTPYPDISIVDASDPMVTRPLYTLSSRNGDFRSHFQLVDIGSFTQIYTVVNGFDVPKYEVFDKRILGEELSPGFMGYGYDYHASVPLSWMTGGGQWLSSLKNRISANPFRYYGQRIWDRFGNRTGAATGLSEQASRFSYPLLHKAKIQAEAVNELPTLAEMFVGQRSLPWTGENRAAAVEGDDAEIRSARAGVGIKLLELQVKSFGDSRTPLGDPSYLIPTSKGTATEAYVDTVQEGDLIRLAIQVGELGVARELLDFYRRRSMDGRELLHAAYDGRSGTALTMELGYARAKESAVTAAAHLSIASSALAFARVSGRQEYFEMSRRIYSLLVDRFLAAAPHEGPKGLCRQMASVPRQVLSLAFYPDSMRFSTADNARFFRGLNELVEEVRRFGMADNERLRWEAIIEEQRDWLGRYLLPWVQELGVVPSGVFELREITAGEWELALERWTDPDGWLAFLQVAETLGAGQEDITEWLENLAKVHGVWVGERWGLDWSLPLLRSEVISTDLTAYFYRVALETEHQAAASFSAGHLASIFSGETVPTVVTDQAPAKALKTGQGRVIEPREDKGGWPETQIAFMHLYPSSITDLPVGTLKSGASNEEGWGEDIWALNDWRLFLWAAGIFYGALLLATLLWWRFRLLRAPPEKDDLEGELVPRPVMARAEERWAKRVLGMQLPEGTTHSRLSNAPVEHNFLMQLRAIYKLVMEWRRLENGWEEESAELVDSDSDEWLNGMDEFATILGIYMRYVVKAGCKDGLRQEDVLEECEDSNHIWSRLVMYLSEPYWGLMALMRRYRNAVTHQEKATLYGQISDLLGEMGMRQRNEAFDARKDFNYPVDPKAFDMMVIQRPGASLKDVLMNASMKLRIPFSHLAAFVERFKAFKRREVVDPIHPYLIEAAKLLPHFVMLAIGSLVYYNQFRIGDSPLTISGASEVLALVREPWSVAWIFPLVASLVCSVAAYVSRVYRFDSSMLERERPGMLLDATLTALVGRKHRPMPEIKPGWIWNPWRFEWAAWATRCVGFAVLLGMILDRQASSFSNFLLWKGVIGMLLVWELIGVCGPLGMNLLSRWVQERTRDPKCPRFLQFLNSLNLTVTHPASPFWLSMKYHFQPSVPSGTVWSRLQSIGFYFGFVGLFFLVGGFICQEVVALWFNDTYLTGATWKLAVGGVLFWNTMYLLRYGLFVLLTGLGSLLSTFPLKTLAALWAFVWLSVTWLGETGVNAASIWGGWDLWISGIMIVAVLGEEAFLKVIQRARGRVFSARSRSDGELGSSHVEMPSDAKLGVVFVGGDDLGHLKLTPDLLVSRWRVLDEKLGAKAIGGLRAGLGDFSETQLQEWLTLLFRLEQEHEVTLWHPMQLRTREEACRFVGHERLEIVCADEEERECLLNAWMIRRWLVSMMSSAGHSQDTSIDLVEIAARMASEALGDRCVFYIIQNKYDAREDNRPVEADYLKGELSLRDKLSELLEWMAPGSRAVSLQNWTPFGFKSGVMTGMDLVYEEALEVTSLLVLDRNATVADYDNLMVDIRESLANPNQVISITSRGTTNTLTEVGKGSQLIEEGHRSFLRGVMGWLGGRASEGVGTGWGNLLANTYGRVQRAMTDSRSPRMPLTSRMRRGSSFALRTEGLIGFGPHAVGISEDTWAVSQAAHNISAMGGQVSFTTSRAFWHKIRETWSHAEWPAAFPRWSGGYLQMMHDPIMQRINDFGPASVFSKEVRANSGRSFLMVPFALVNILLLPLAILLDVTPFVQILVVLWNLGFVMNQVLTIHGLSVALETSGFHRGLSLLGGGSAVAAAVMFPQLSGGVPWLPFTLTMAALYAGFFVGINRWLFSRLRDVMLFGPQLVFHTLGQWMRQTIEFVASGAAATDAEGVNMAYRVSAGPREDRPLAQYPHFINLRTIFWGIGVPSIVLNLVALSRLDMFNTLLLLPSLLFSVSLVMGPFLMAPKRGHTIGMWALVPRVGGWLSVCAGLMGLSMLMAWDGFWPWLGLMGVLMVVIALLWLPGRFLGFQRRLQRWVRLGVHQLEKMDIPEAERSNCIALLTALQIEELTKVLGQQTTGGMGRTLRAISLLTHSLRAAGSLGRTARWDRFLCEYRRALLVGFGVFAWFLVVPVPGLFVLSAGVYKTSLSLQGILGGLGLIIAVTLLGLGVVRLLQKGERGELGVRGLHQRTTDILSTLPRLARSNDPLAARHASEACGEFAEYLIFLDQESYVYARRVLDRIEARLTVPTVGAAEK